MNQQARALIHQLEEARAAITTLLPDAEKHLAQEIYPGWTIRHMLAHMTGWDDAIIGSLQAHVAGGEPHVPANKGIDEHNAKTVTTRETLDYDHVRREWEQTRNNLLNLLRQMPEEKFNEPLVFPWGRKGKVPHMISIFIEHEQEHAGDIQTWLKNPDQPHKGSH